MVRSKKLVPIQYYLWVQMEGEEPKCLFGPTPNTAEISQFHNTKVKELFGVSITCVGRTWISTDSEGKVKVDG